MNDVVTFITGRFPTYRGKILDYIENDEDFRGLCEDFHSCVKMQETHRQGKGEYQALALDLEKEIAKFLERPTARRV